VHLLLKFGYSSVPSCSINYILSTGLAQTLDKIFPGIIGFDLGMSELRRLASCDVPLEPAQIGRLGSHWQ
jgi:hypothetical protein